MSIKNNFSNLENLRDGVETTKGMLRAAQAMSSYAYRLYAVARAAEELRDAQKNGYPFLDLVKALDEAIAIASKPVSEPSHGY